MLFYFYAFAMPLHHLNSFFVPYIFTPSIDPLPLLSSISYSSGNSPLNHPLSPPSSPCRPISHPRVCLEKVTRCRHRCKKIYRPRLGGRGGSPRPSHPTPIQIQGLLRLLHSAPLISTRDIEQQQSRLVLWSHHAGFRLGLRIYHAGFRLVLRIYQAGF